ncbi:MAG: competence/damage-inducible protein A [Solirubrobacteraceae bacterium]
MIDAAVYQRQGRVRAAVLVTGTEVLSGAVSDRNGPWLSARLREAGLDVAAICIVADRPSELRTALDQLSAAGLDLLVTTGGLGPTADDVTAQVVAEFCGRQMGVDRDLEARIQAIIDRNQTRRPKTEAQAQALRAGVRKQATVPSGALVLEPRGTAPGLIVDGALSSAGQVARPAVVVLPGPPREMQAMWPDVAASELFRGLSADAGVYENQTVRLYGVSEADLADSLRLAQQVGLRLEDLEVTTCMRGGEIEISTRFQAQAEADHSALVEFLADRFEGRLFSRDGATIDQQVAAMLISQAETIAAAESCTGGLLTGRLTSLPGSSAYVIGSVVVYSNWAKSSLTGVDPELIAAHGAVSIEVAQALASGVRRRFGTTIGVGVTGVAGPGGGTPDKPVGYVCFAVAHGPVDGPDDQLPLVRERNLPGDRTAVRERSTTIALHLIAQVLQDARAQASAPPGL